MPSMDAVRVIGACRGREAMYLNAQSRVSHVGFVCGGAGTQGAE